MSEAFYLHESLAVADAAVAAVLHMESGRVLPAHEVIGHDYDKAIQLCMSLQGKRGQIYLSTLILTSKAALE